MKDEVKEEDVSRWDPHLFPLGFVRTCPVGKCARLEEDTEKKDKKGKKEDKKAKKVGAMGFRGF